jgi:glucose-6-phosphate isomerase
MQQIGCRVGKVLAQRSIPELSRKAEAELEHDSSTNNLIRRYRKQRGTAQ